MTTGQISDGSPAKLLVAKFLDITGDQILLANFLPSTVGFNALIEGTDPKYQLTQL